MNGRAVDITEQILGAAIAVHRALGPGLLESAYQACLAFELVDRGLAIVRQTALPVVYRGARIDCGYRLDRVVEGEVIVEIKAVERILPVQRFAGAGRDVGGRSRLGAAQPALRRGAPDSRSTSAEVI